MNKVYDLKSILSAIEEINSKKKNKPISFVPTNIDTTQEVMAVNDGILPITEKLILEAEEHSKKFKNDTLIPSTITEDVLFLPTITEDVLVLPTITEDVLVLDKEYNEQNLEIINLEQIKNLVINDLYSTLSKKVKKNTLKIIFNLRQKINDLEKTIETLSTNKTNDDSTQDNIKINFKQNVNEEHLINEDNTEINEDNKEINEEFLRNEIASDLSEDTIKILKHQNSLIKNFEKNEEKLRSKIVDLEQDIILLGNKKINIPNKIASIDIEFNQPITKIKSELFFFKENYEKLIIVNDDLKKKLANSQNRIVTFENNIKEIESIFEILRNTLSKNSVIKLNDPLLNIQAKVDQSKKD